MSTETKPDNPPAFPAERYEPCDEDYVRVKHAGMTLRDYFAAQALPAVLDSYLKINGPGLADHALRNVPVLVYKYADALLQERSKR